METQDGSGEESREKRGKRGEGFLNVRFIGHILFYNYYTR